MKWREERRDELIYKAVLSADPQESSDYIVIAIYFDRHKLAFWRHGDFSWTVISNNVFINDVIWYYGAFYVVGSNNKMWLVELGVNNKLVEFSSQDSVNLYSWEKYLVDFMGDLFLIFRKINSIEDDNDEGNGDEDDVEDNNNEIDDDDVDEDDGENNQNEIEDDDGFEVYYPWGADIMYFLYTESFMLFKFDRGEKKFIELKSINGHNLFVGSNHAVVIPTTIMEKTTSSNIYFTDDDIDTNHMYIYRDSGLEILVVTAVALTFQHRHP
ncbi:uncharacterized protein LOC120280483 [Dioscorea cayenensis subsp. rotundata]|uniref:Uncharacterized protein LOC120280483 n=1 Tax=Dioscorea cayennensis subsp. rotundata TaxID=55577 RepID=A0AB40CVP1_DIOCR|nr:uncharacterized protein LOC120280483 [Dioscorea cayenensis subsp. rotundata]